MAENIAAHENLWVSTIQKQKTKNWIASPQIEYCNFIFSLAVIQAHKFKVPKEKYTKHSVIFEHQ